MDAVISQMSMGSCVGQSSDSAKSQGNHISIYNTAPCIFGELVESSILYALLQVDCYIKLKVHAGLQFMVSNCTISSLHNLP